MPAQLFKITSLSAVHNIRSKRIEHLLCLTIDSDKELISCHTVAIGTTTSVPADPLKIFALAIADLASEIIVIHNHPSGWAIPSEEDIATVREFVIAGQFLGISVLDHIIVTKREAFSFRYFGLITSE